MFNKKRKTNKEIEEMLRGDFNIHIEKNSEKNIDVIELNGNALSIMSGIAIICDSLVSSGYPEEMIKGAIEAGISASKIK